MLLLMKVPNKQYETMARNERHAKLSDIQAPRHQLLFHGSWKTVLILSQSTHMQ